MTLLCLSRTPRWIRQQSISALPPKYTQNPVLRTTPLPLLWPSLCQLIWTRVSATQQVPGFYSCLASASQRRAFSNHKSDHIMPLLKTSQESHITLRIESTRLPPTEATATSSKHSPLQIQVCAPGRFVLKAVVVGASWGLRDLPLKAPQFGG